MVQFIWRHQGERRKRALFMERSRFAVKNYKMIMQVDEDSRRRKHEMKHQMETQKFRFPYNAGVLLMYLTKMNKNQHKKTGKLDMFLKKEIV